MGQRDIKIKFTDYRADIVLDVPFEGNIPEAVLVPVPAEVLEITINNSLGEASVNVYYRNGASVDVTETVTYSKTIQVLKNTKISIGRANPIQYDITGIQIYDASGKIIKDSKANLFDLENVQQNYKINVDSQKNITTDNIAKFTSILSETYKWNTELNKQFGITIGTQNASYVKYYFIVSSR
jgi:hypothetical protein